MARGTFIHMQSGKDSKEFWERLINKFKSLLPPKMELQWPRSAVHIGGLVIELSGNRECYNSYLYDSWAVFPAMFPCPGHRRFPHRPLDRIRNRKSTSQPRHPFPRPQRFLLFHLRFGLVSHNPLVGQEQHLKHDLMALDK